MKLLVQPGDGVGPLVKAIERAKKSIQIVIFRFDRMELEKALEDAVKRGVAVDALIAFTNRGGEKNLRKLELRFLDRGVTVARTADDLVRYHGKMMIIDRKELHLLAFNFTQIDTERSRSFGLITQDKEIVREAIELFEADSKRRPYKAGSSRFLVSPLNARKELAEFIRNAKKELLIYDVKITDRSMLKLLEEAAKNGIEIRVIGKMARHSSQIAIRSVSNLRLHTRTMIRDGKDVFIGSQSLRELELDSRREIGIVFRDAEIAERLTKVFEADWKGGTVSPDDADDVEKPVAAKVAKKVAKSLVKILPPVAPVVEEVAKEVFPNGKNGLNVDHDEIEETVKIAVKQAVKQAVREVVEDVAEQQREPEA
ncbi:MAG TPA: phospholipase D-like domain-containing protein [Terriglobales bacterium]|nr:phospholipase D-like domain-containing protein [Terriglobales bacterium]